MKDKHLIKLFALFPEIEEHISLFTHKNETISSASIGWHIDHSFRSIDLMCQDLHADKEETYQPKFNIPKLIVFGLGFIPRGKAKAPQSATSEEEEITESELREQLKKTKAIILQLETLPKDAYLRHPFFGHLSRAKSFRLLYLHTVHHLKIIREIRRSIG